MERVKAYNVDRQRKASKWRKHLNGESIPMVEAFSLAKCQTYSKKDHISSFLAFQFMIMTEIKSQSHPFLDA